MTIKRLNEVGEVKVDEMKGIHPKMAVKLLKDLGFKKSIDKKTGLWYIQSVQKILSKPESKLSQMERGEGEKLNREAKNYLNMIVKLVNSNAIYNPSKEDKVEREFKKSEDPLPEAIEKLGIKRHTPINWKKERVMNWKQAAMNKYNRLMMPRLGGVNMGLGLSPVLSSGFGATATYGGMVGGGGEIKMEHISAVSEYANNLMRRLERRGQITKEQIGEINKKLKQMDDIEVELTKILRTYKDRKSTRLNSSH